MSRLSQRGASGPLRSLECGSLLPLLVRVEISHPTSGSPGPTIQGDAPQGEKSFPLELPLKKRSSGSANRPIRKRVWWTRKFENRRSNSVAFTRS